MKEIELKKQIENLEKMWAEAEKKNREIAVMFSKCYEEKIVFELALLEIFKLAQKEGFKEENREEIEKRAAILTDYGHYLGEKYEAK